jgi:penicillin-binding protein 2
MSILDDRYRGAPTPSRNRPHGNLTALRVAVLLVFGLLTARLVSMQLVDGATYAKRSRENHIVSTNILPPRGLILGRDGTPLVQNIGVYTASVTPELLPKSQADRHKIYLRLEELVGVPSLEVQSRVQQAEDDGRPDLPIPVQKYLSKEQALMLDEATTGMPGVALTVTPGRNYIGSDAFSHIIGYIGAQTPREYAQLKGEGYQLNEPVGKSGIEGRYESELRGSAGVSQVEQDAQGQLLDVLKTRDPAPGNSLRLAIDPGLQEFVAELLDNSMGEAKIAAAVVLSPRTGEVYALVSLPSYDANIFAQPDQRSSEYNALANDPRKPFLDRALTAEAPGSTFKLITAAAALQEGTITPATGRTVNSTVLEFKGENGVIYPLYDWRAHGFLNLRSAIAWSSNIYFYMASCGIPNEGIKGLGKDFEDSAWKLGAYARAFGLGQPTGIDLDGEMAGVVPSPDQKRKAFAGSQFNENDRDWFYADTCFMGIGQGDVSATPLQIARVTAAVANGGKLLTPRLVKDVTSPDGKILKSMKSESKQVPISAENLAVIRDGMHESVGYGAGLRAQTAGIDIAGKTGTAEFGPVKSDGKRDQHAWFTGFAPFNSPDVVVTVYFDLGVGGDKAAPTASKIFDYFFKNVKP